MWKMRKFTTLSVIVIMLFITLLLLVLPRISTGPAGWKEDVRLTNDSADSGRPDITVDSSDSVHVVWGDARSPGGTYYKNLMVTVGATMYFLGNMVFLRFALTLKITFM